MDKWQIRFFLFEFRVSCPFKPQPFFLEQLSGVFLGCNFTDTDVILKADKPKIGNKTVKNAFKWSAHPSRHLEWPQPAFGDPRYLITQADVYQSGKWLPEDRDVVGTAGWTFLAREVCREEGGADLRLLQEIILLACDIWLEQSHAGSSWPASRQATQPLWHRETASCLQQAAYAC